MEGIRWLWRPTSQIGVPKVTEKQMNKCLKLIYLWGGPLVDKTTTLRFRPVVCSCSPWLGQSPGRSCSPLGCSEHNRFAHQMGGPQLKFAVWLFSRNMTINHDIVGYVHYLQINYEAWGYDFYCVTYSICLRVEPILLYILVGWIVH